MSELFRKIQPTSAGAGEIIRLLGALAAHKRFVEADERPDSRTATVFGADGKAVTTCLMASLSVARRKGWIAPSETDGRIGITAAGRQALKRSRSAIVAERADGSLAGRKGQPSVPGTVNPKESPLTWLASRRDATGRPMLTEAQIAAGERLRSDLYFAQLMPRVTMGWTGLPSSDTRGAVAAGLGETLADTVVAARARVAAALKSVGPESADILIDVCGHLRGLEEISRAEGWPRRAARLILQRALIALARHYGLEPEVGMDLLIQRRLRHWGAEDYRPTLTRWSGRTSDAQDE